MKRCIEQGSAGRPHIGFRLEAVGEMWGLQRIGWANWANEWFGRRISAQFANLAKNTLPWHSSSSNVLSGWWLGEGKKGRN